MEEKDVVKVTIHYEDGTTEEATKGVMIIEESGEDDTVSTTFYPVNMDSLDIASLTLALMRFTEKLGGFDNMK